MRRSTAIRYVIACVIIAFVAVSPAALAASASTDDIMTLQENAGAGDDCGARVADLEWGFAAAHGDDDDDDDDYCVCHRAPGHPDNSATVCGSAGAICAHLRHGDAIGECAVACGGPDMVACEDGQFCKLPDGECSDDAEGLCMDNPTTCPSVFAPVCSCDGNTYSNACFADTAGVAVEAEGACEEPVACGGAAGDTCGMGQYCKTADGDCGEDGAGTCTDVPETCPVAWAPVCGCNGMTYDNACLAAGAGVSVAEEGTCDDDNSCGGDIGNTCGDGEFCKAPEGECGEGAEGECTERLDMCPAIFEPVCGCDGTTYDNACLADAAGVSVDSAGECPRKRGRVR